jgi:hypothetical protein
MHREPELMRRLLLALALLAACQVESSRPPSGTPAADPLAGLDAREARGKFCELVFGIGDVSQIVGINRFEPVEATRALEPGVGECVYAAGTDASASLTVDCRDEHPRLEGLRGSLEGQPGFRTVDVGEGGFYTSADGPVHKLTYVSQRPACTVYVATSGVPGDNSEALARHVAKRLAPADAAGAAAKPR